MILDLQPSSSPAHGLPLPALAQAVVELNHFLGSRRPDLRFACETHDGVVQVLIVDAVTGSPLRRMETVEALRTARLLEHERLGLVRHQA